MMNIAKRKLLGLAGTWPWLAACVSTSGEHDSADPLARFRGIGVVLVVDAIPGVELKGVEFYDDRHATIYAKSTQSQRNRDIMALGGARVPLAVRVVWRSTYQPISGPNLYGRQSSFTYAGELEGDHTLPIAQRIPAELLKEIRSRGGALRLKFRLKGDGVLFGWDIERSGGSLSEFFMPGGDFKEARIYNGKAIEPGWYIDKNGTKVLTDY